MTELEVDPNVRDIVGQPCYVCGKGVAIVVHYIKANTKKHRFFYGCSASTVEEKCRGTRAWERLAVPEELRAAALRDKGLPPQKPRAPQRAKGKAKIKKRPATENDAVSDDGDAAAEDDVLYVKVKKEKTTTTVTRRRAGDARFWTQIEDDDFAPRGPVKRL